MKVAEFDFDLPPEFIADRPVEPRDAARLLVVGEVLSDRVMTDLPSLLRPGDIMVFNDARVIPARLTGRRRGAKVEVTLHKRVEAGVWLAFARPAKRLKQGDRIEFAPDFACEVAAKGEAGEVTLRFACHGAALMAALDRFGIMPLPPYIKRPAGGDARDREDYQTIFADAPSAVAAPTAGLHFTPDLMAALDARGVRGTFVTLHVGAGTFLPVKVEETEEHKMHSEFGVISAVAAADINRARAAGGRVVAVGTTSLRLLESAADADGAVRPFEGDTDLFIVPGYRFRAVDLLLSNFHMPRSTLFMLVAAFAGLTRMNAAYDHAKASGYRFYSYGDCTLLSPEGAR